MVLCKLLVLSLVLCAAFATSHYTGQTELDDEWESWKSIYNKTYLVGDANVSKGAESYRRFIWESTLKKIRDHNLHYQLGQSTFRLGINQFADMLPEEVAKLLNGYKPDITRQLNASSGITRSSFLPPHNVLLPPSIDWRTKGYVSEVKNQGQCGSCWAFSTTGSVEGQTKAKTGTLADLSEQQLVDCSGSFGNLGCNGGLMDMAFKYIHEKGIESEQAYPYTAEDDQCRYDSSRVVTRVTGFTDIEQGNETALQIAVATIGPVSVAIDASQGSFQSYRDGIYYEKACSQTQLDHGVLVVGYGSTSDGDYWLVKNSWGPTWGEDGYIRMARNRKNMCGIAEQASYPLL